MNDLGKESGCLWRGERLLLQGALESFLRVPRAAEEQPVDPFYC